MARDDIASYSLVELKARRRQRGGSNTRSDAPVFPVPDDFWENAHVVMPGRKTSVHLRLDAEVFEWFKAQGRGHLTRMSAVLRSYAQAHAKSRARTTSDPAKRR